MGEALRHGFANLTNFAGRDSRSLFWWWVLLIAVVVFGLSMISGIVFLVGSMGSAMQAGAVGIEQEQIQADMMRYMAGSAETQAWIGVAISLIGLFLLIASFVRRLRDAGLPVLIAIIPVLTTVVASYANLAGVDALRAAMTTGDAQLVRESSSGLGLVAYAGYLVVIVCGLIPSKNAN
ncbi:DUF805 domain-containing protein [Alteriqipengyuania sp. NZ-12B]|uniref:DUF805 domain-containing protein n=1 Tax=Alteriqipengyuania abyssalis TaxID=2860200 RepID=A0ABS7PAM5_9SPHN|nr:DUF805 domain-containing protein [Alteriqipengyuania abyssalis]MBY8336109.1 DUF805 domain-containing protein [Alteriqipengyuania abyssalis]